MTRLLRLPQFLTLVPPPAGAVRRAPYPFEIAAPPQVREPDERIAKNTSISRNANSRTMPRPSGPVVRRRRVDLLRRVEPHLGGQRFVRHPVRGAEHDRPREEEREFHIEDRRTAERQRRSAGRTESTQSRWALRRTRRLRPSPAMGGLAGRACRRRDSPPGTPRQRARKIRMERAMRGFGSQGKRNEYGTGYACWYSRRKSSRDTPACVRAVRSVDPFRSLCPGRGHRRDRPVRLRPRATRGPRRTTWNPNAARPRRTRSSGASAGNLGTAARPSGGDGDSATNDSSTGPSSASAARASGPNVSAWDARTARPLPSATVPLADHHAGASPRRVGNVPVRVPFDHDFQHPSHRRLLVSTRLGPAGLRLRPHRQAHPLRLRAPPSGSACLAPRPLPAAAWRNPPRSRRGCTR